MLTGFVAHFSLPTLVAPTSPCEMENGLLDEMDDTAEPSVELSASSQRIVRRFSGLIIGIRPSIFSLVGLGSFGADHLARPGRVAWAVAMHELCDDARLLLNGADSPPDADVLAALIRWIDLDRTLEPDRWAAAETMLRHMQVVFKDEPRVQSSDTLRFLCDTWVTNLTDLTRDVRSGDVSLGRGSTGLLHAIEASVQALPAPSRLAGQLQQLDAFVGTDTASEFPRPLIAPCGRDELRRLLRLARPDIAGPPTGAVRSATGNVARSNTALRGASGHGTTQHAQSIDR